MRYVLQTCLALLLILSLTGCLGVIPVIGAYGDIAVKTTAALLGTDMSTEVSKFYTSDSAQAEMAKPFGRRAYVFVPKNGALSEVALQQQIGDRLVSGIVGKFKQDSRYKEVTLGADELGDYVKRRHASVEPMSSVEQVLMASRDLKLAMLIMITDMEIDGIAIKEFKMHYIRLSDGKTLLIEHYKFPKPTAIADATNAVGKILGIQEG